MKIEPATLVETIAASVPGAMAVFDSVGIDYACGARLSLREAAEIAGMDPATLATVLQALAPADKPTEWSERSLTDIARQITAEHHAMIRDQLPRIALGLASHCGVNRRPADLSVLRAELARLSGEIIPHLHDEERNVFQFVEAMEAAWQRNEPPPPLDHGLRKRIGDLTVAHGSIAERLHRIRNLRLGVNSDTDVAPDCRATLELLEKFESHLHQQMFIENCIFFPRALALAEQLSGSATNATA